MAASCRCGVMASVSHYCSALGHCWVSAPAKADVECRCDCVNCVTSNHAGCYYSPTVCPIKFAQRDMQP
jgi:hypothetical protein